MQIIDRIRRTASGGQLDFSPFYKYVSIYVFSKTDSAIRFYIIMQKRLIVML